MKPSFSNYIRTGNLYTRILKFSVVGITGILVNMAVLFILTEIFHIVYYISSIIAIELSIIANFFFNNFWTWKDRVRKKLRVKFFQYHVSVGLTAVLINWGLLILLTEVVGVYYLISNLIGIAAGMLVNFLINDLWTFKN